VGLPLLPLRLWEGAGGSGVWHWRFRMITPAQLRAARALLGIDQRDLAERSGLSVPTIQRMEASEGVIRGNVDSLMKLIGALDAAGIELIGDDAVSSAGGRGVRLKRAAPRPKDK
jgi:transcriptional regulator with XRE-family HTH domain